MDNWMIVLQMIGGAGILIFGIDMMKNALEKISENWTEKILGALTKNRLTGIVTGAVVTVINQKSVATVAMVVGMVNAGVITLVQGAGVIMGANIGTTITAQLLAFPLQKLAPVIVGAGVVLWRIRPLKKISHAGGAIAGFGLMFIGMYIMETGMTAIAQVGTIANLLARFDEMSVAVYMGAMLCGFISVAIVRSSTVMMGVVIAMGIGGLIGFDLAMPLILGINTGKCISVLYLEFGANRTARLAAAFQSVFYITGTIIFILFFRHFMESAVTWLAPDDLPRQIAFAHTLFNLGNAILLSPFVKQLVGLSGKLVFAPEDAQGITVLNLDKRMLDTPGLALAQTGHELTVMARTTFNNYAVAFQAFVDQDSKMAELVSMEEDNVNRMQKEIEAYLVRLSRQNISDRQRKEASLYLSICADIESIGDLAESLIRFGQYGEENDIHLSEEAMKEMEELHMLVCGYGDKMVKALSTNNADLAAEILAESTSIEEWQQQYKKSHLDRLGSGRCLPGSGAIFIDLIADLAAIVRRVRSICQAVIDGRSG